MKSFFFAFHVRMYVNNETTVLRRFSRRAKKATDERTILSIVGYRLSVIGYSWPVGCCRFLAGATCDELELERRLRW